ncbi:MAG: hypothetical protein AAB542_02965 [Patescibacteria group bacterium]
MRQKRSLRSETPVHWLPIDSRLVFPLLSFGRVRGVAKFFLTIEMVLAVGVVGGTFVLVLLRFAS